MTTTHPGGTERPADPCAFVILGASGDLTRRKLLPALYNLRRHGLLPKEFAIVGVARAEMSQDAFRAKMRDEIQQFATVKVDKPLWKDFEERLYYVHGDFKSPTLYERMRQVLQDAEKKHQTGGNAVFYLATPPDLFADIVEMSGKAGLAREEGGRWRRFVVEKPFGRDLDSARELTRRLSSVLSETQIYRIDHYLGKETVQNILVFRFANGIFEPIWNRRYVDHIQITVAETLGVEGRGGYYDKAGALRDIMQNHMFQLLALVAMEPPISFEAEPVRDEKVKVLKAVRPMQPEEILQRTVRGQYGEGFLDGKKVPAYRAEPSVSPASNTETYAAVKLYLDNWRWSGVPFYLRTGKRLCKRTTHIVLHMRRPPLLAFGTTPIEELDPNRIVIQIQPDEGIRIEMKAKQPGSRIALSSVDLEFSYKELGEVEEATGYERLLYDCMIGDQTLFHRSDMVEAAWRIATPILDVWGSLPPRDFPNYGSFTWGPAAADQLIQRDGRTWYNV